MNKAEIVNRLAVQSGITRAEAADQLDRVVHDIIARLRRKRVAPLPGLGLFKLGPNGSIQFEKETKGARPR